MQTTIFIPSLYNGMFPLLQVQKHLRRNIYQSQLIHADTCMFAAVSAVAADTAIIHAGLLCYLSLLPL